VSHLLEKSALQFMGVLGLTRLAYFFLQDYNLALTLLDDEPYATLAGQFSLTAENYGTIPRYFIKTGQAHTFTSAEFDEIIAENQPKKVYTLQNSDHSAFFSQPALLVSTLKVIYYTNES
jgi:hypothetical protein